MYSASGNAKVRGAVEQVERALEEGELKFIFAIQGIHTQISSHVHGQWQHQPMSFAICLLHVAMQLQILQGKP